MLLVVVGVITVWPRSSGDEEVASGTVPQSTSTLDTSPFDFGLQDDGPTTIPDGILTTTTSAPPPTTTTLPPTTTTSTTTTTIPPTTTTTLPFAPEDDPVCQAVLRFYQFLRGIQVALNNVDIVRTVGETRLREATILLLRTKDPKYEPAIGLIYRVRTDLREARTFDQALDAIRPLSDPGYDARLQPLEERSQSSCPDFQLS